MNVVVAEEVLVTDVGAGRALGELRAGKLPGGVCGRSVGRRAAGEERSIAGVAGPGHGRRHGRETNLDWLGRVRRTTRSCGSGGRGSRGRHCAVQGSQLYTCRVEFERRCGLRLRGEVRGGC